MASVCMTVDGDTPTWKLSSEQFTILCKFPVFCRVLQHSDQSEAYRNQNFPHLSPIIKSFRATYNHGNGLFSNITRFCSFLPNPRIVLPFSTCSFSFFLSNSTPSPEYHLGNESINSACSVFQNISPFTFLVRIYVCTGWGTGWQISVSYPVGLTKNASFVSDNSIIQLDSASRCAKLVSTAHFQPI